MAVNAPEDLLLRGALVAVDEFCDVASSSYRDISSLTLDMRADNGAWISQPFRGARFIWRLQ